MAGYLCVLLDEHLCHQLSVLSVDTCDGPDVFTGLQRLVELRVPQHHHVFVGHEHLERVHSVLPHQGLHLITHLSAGHKGQRSGIRSDACSQSAPRTEKVLV